MSDASPVLLTPDVVGGLAGKRVLVVGDIMLDAYLIGDADRISPEAPVPVVRIEKERYLLGGAGNVARNIVALGGVATLAGVMGKDASADRIRGLVRDEGICGAFVTLPQRPTTVKTRVMARRQQMLLAADLGQRFGAQALRQRFVHRGFLLLPSATIS